MAKSAGKTTPGLLKGVTWCSAGLIVAGLGLLVWSQFAGDGWISVGVASLVVLSLGVLLALWAGVWHLVVARSRGAVEE
ncbi:hypothetical protein GCM10009585_13920 [Brevibacterium paucivorans]|uniref:hypothetical protein n=1 Tax=Brevibacterium paucivorans TaxID=170994 RepID=UPI0031CF9C99